MSARRMVLASLDAENETFIQEAISRLMKNKTVIIIAHRMRTVSGEDKIVVIDNGHAAETAKPSELINKNGIYAKMVKLQTAEQGVCACTALYMTTEMV